MPDFHVASFYRFQDIDDPQALRERLQAACGRRKLLGTILVAPEGINGTVTGERGDIESLLETVAGSDHPLGHIKATDVPAFSRIGMESDFEEIDMSGGVEEIRAALD